MTFVWKESLKQAEGMLQSWTKTAESSTPSFAKDTRTLSLNVLAATGFRRSYEFRSSSQPESGELETYRDALQTVLDNSILLMLVPFRLLRLPFVPKAWARIGIAGESFKRHMVDMLRQETSLKEKGEKGTGSLMTSLVRALDTYQEGVSSSQDHRDHTPAKGLTAEEIFGNIFVINFAGHDTTANALAFSMLLLAVHPEVQSWVAEEIQEVINSDKCEAWDYKLLFPKLLRCRAVMLETLRVYPPILALAKWTNRYPQELRVGERTIAIPPNTGVMPSLLAIQTHPTYWQDPLLWKPSRWISSTSATASDNPQIDSNGQARQETLLVPAQSTFFPWSDGPQNCPGTKFAQVEFVAVLACLLQNHRVHVTREPGEDFQQAKKRVLATTEDCDLQLLLRMRNADSVHLEWDRV
ncbi:MAG: hypothetical protein M1831_000142 [Alyxoria varia]|nr:MAG: hypothetical protein M1831_000142 [Alyxoria varia]